jgi:hypothetical protein
MSTTQLTITVSGGDDEENAQLSNLLEASLRENRFTDVRVTTPGHRNVANYSLSDLVQAVHPAFLRTPVRIVPAQPDADPRLSGAFDFNAGTFIQPVDFRFAQ